MEIDRLEGHRIGGVLQRIRVCGVDAANPVLLLLQLGPGLPMISERQRMQRLLRLEDDFTVVYWDQRGTGLSSPPLRTGPDEFPISVPRMVDDTVSMLELLRRRFGRKPIVAGFSFGATFAAYAAARRPELVAALVATGMDIDVPAAEEHAYAFALDAARRHGHRRATRQLEAIGPPPHTDPARFRTRARWVANFGGVTTGATYRDIGRTLLASLLRSPDYSVTEVLRALRGVTASQAALLPELSGTDLVPAVPRLDVPLVLVQGRRDQVAPGDAAQRLSDSLAAPSTQLVWFEASAHTPHLEEPARFRDVLLSVRAGQLAAT